MGLSKIICIISDTHDNKTIVHKAVKMIKACSPLLVLHCGDVESPSTLELFEALPLRLVQGNNDYPLPEMSSTIKSLGFGEFNEDLELEVDGTRLYMTHGHLGNLVPEMVSAQIYDFVFHGHTHLVRHEQVGRTQIVNPGACYRASRFTFAQLDLETRLVKFIEIPRDA